jgi:hypothetical protein
MLADRSRFSRRRPWHDEEASDDPLLVLLDLSDGVTVATLPVWRASAFAT